VLRTAQAVTPTLTARSAFISLTVFCAIYALIFVFGTLFIYRLLRAGPAGRQVLTAPESHTSLGLAVLDSSLAVRE
jgi:cytochrome d ubiquinol oxidase subunit I